MNTKNILPAVITCLLISSFAVGEISNFTESFDNDANWVGADNTSVNFLPSGGPDGSSYISYTGSIASLADDDSAIGFRGNDFNDASGDAFVGNWIESGVDQFSFSFRHDLPAPAFVFARFASSFNFPGGIAIQFAPALPNTWTDVTVDISAGNPQFISFEGEDFDAVFSDVGNIQLGVAVPTGFGGFPAPVTFDVDNVTVSTSTIPEPNTAVSIFGLGFFSLMIRRKS